MNCDVPIAMLRNSAELYKRPFKRTHQMSSKTHYWLAFRMQCRPNTRAHTQQQQQQPYLHCHIWCLFFFSLIQCIFRVLGSNAVVLPSIVSCILSPKYQFRCICRFWLLLLSLYVCYKFNLRWWWCVHLTSSFSTKKVNLIYFIKSIFPFIHFHFISHLIW